VLGGGHHIWGAELFPTPPMAVAEVRARVLTQTSLAFSDTVQKEVVHGHCSAAVRDELKGSAIQTPSVRIGGAVRSRIGLGDARRRRCRS